MLYYALIKYRDQFLFTLFFIIALIISLNFNMAIDSLLSLFLSIYILSLISPKIRRRINDTILIILVFTIVITFTISWILKIQLSFIGVIDDNKMLVFGTFLFVFLTYMAMKKNTEIFQYQRMPYLIMEFDKDSNEEFLFTFKNIRDFPANNIYIKFEIIYPLPGNSWPSLLLFVKQQLKLILFRLSIIPKPDFFISFVSERLEPNDCMKINILDQLLRYVPINSKPYQGNLKRYYSDKEIYFNIISNYTYSSKEKFLSEDPTYNIFKFKSDLKGIELIHKSGEPIEITFK